MIDEKFQPLLQQKRDLAQRCGVPEHMVDALAYYVVAGLHPGDFLERVLANDLMGALDRADYINMRALPEYGKFLYAYAPRVCWGSGEVVQNWTKMEGLTKISEEGRSLHYRQVESVRQKASDVQV